MKKENVYDFYEDMERKVNAGKSIKGIISEFKQFVNTCGLCLTTPTTVKLVKIEIVRNMLSFKMSDLEPSTFLSVAKMATDNLAKIIGEDE